MSTLFRVLWIPAIIYVVVAVLNALFQTAFLPAQKTTKAIYKDIQGDVVVKISHPSILRRDGPSQTGTIVVQLVEWNGVLSNAQPAIPLGSPLPTVCLNVQPVTYTLALFTTDTGVVLGQEDSAGAPMLNLSTCGEGRVASVPVRLVDSLADSIPISISLMLGTRPLVPVNDDTISVQTESDIAYIKRTLISLLCGSGGAVLALAALIIQWDQKRQENLEAKQAQEQANDLLSMIQKGAYEPFVSQTQMLNNVATKFSEIKAGNGDFVGNYEKAMDNFVLLLPKSLKDHSMSLNVQANSKYLETFEDSAAYRNLSAGAQEWLGELRAALKPTGQTEKEFKDAFLAGYAVAGLLSNKNTDLSSRDKSFQSVTDESKAQAFLRGMEGYCVHTGRDNLENLVEQVMEYLSQDMAKTESIKAAITSAARSMSPTPSKLQAVSVAIMKRWKQASQRSSLTAVTKGRFIEEEKLERDRQQPGYAGEAMSDYVRQFEMRSSSIVIFRQDYSATPDTVSLGRFRRYAEESLRDKTDKDDRVLVVYFLPPRNFLAGVSWREHVTYLARCVGNELFSYACASGDILTLGPDGKNAAVLYEFLAKYDYRLPNMEDCIFDPGFSNYSLQMEQYLSSADPSTFVILQDEVEQTRKSLLSRYASFTVRDTLRDIASVSRATGFKSVFVFLDTTEDMPRFVHRDEYIDLLDEWITHRTDLENQGIYLKLFLQTDLASETKVKSWLESVPGISEMPAGDA